MKLREKAGTAPPHLLWEVHMVSSKAGSCWDCKQAENRLPGEEEARPLFEPLPGRGPLHLSYLLGEPQPQSLNSGPCPPTCLGALFCSFWLCASGQLELNRM